MTIAVTAWFDKELKLKFVAMSIMI